MVKERIYEARFLSKAKEFIQNLGAGDQIKIAAAVKTLEEGDFRSVQIKTLKRHIQELIIKSHRLVFFIGKNHVIYFVDGFIKKTQKTPRNIIENAEDIFREMNK